MTHKLHIRRRRAEITLLDAGTRLIAETGEPPDEIILALKKKHPKKAAEFERKRKDMAVEK